MIMHVCNSRTWKVEAEVGDSGTKQTGKIARTTGDTVSKNRTKRNKHIKKE